VERGEALGNNGAVLENRRLYGFHLPGLLCHVMYVEPACVAGAFVRWECS